MFFDFDELEADNEESKSPALQPTTNSSEHVNVHEQPQHGTNAHGCTQSAEALHAALKIDGEKHPVDSASASLKLALQQPLDSVPCQSAVDVSLEHSSTQLHQDAHKELLCFDSEGVIRGSCDSCNCSSWKSDAGSSLPCHQHDNGNTSLQTIAVGVAAASSVCRRCSCPAHAHKSLMPWFESVQQSIHKLQNPRTSPGSSACSRVELPVVASTWDPMDAAFFALTAGGFDPTRDGRKHEQHVDSLGSSLISVVCPTTEDRQMFHPLLYECFRQQRHEPKELIIVDTGAGPSAFLADCARNDQRVVYRFFYESSDVQEKRRSDHEQWWSCANARQTDNHLNTDSNCCLGERCASEGFGRKSKEPNGQSVDAAPWSLGMKRNIACHLARGQIIAHFDDDDLYASDYLNYMSSQLLGLQNINYADRPLFTPIVATLMEWHLLDLKDLTFGFLNIQTDSWVPPEQKHGWLYGWGFSYVFTKAAWELQAFPDLDILEDIGWMDEMLRLHIQVNLVRLPRKKTPGVEFPLGLCAHSTHPDSCSGGEYTKCVLGTGANGTGLVRAGHAVSQPKAFEGLMPVTRKIIRSEEFRSRITKARMRNTDEGVKYGLREKESLMMRPLTKDPGLWFVSRPPPSAQNSKHTPKTWQQPCQKITPRCW